VGSLEERDNIEDDTNGIKEMALSNVEFIWFGMEASVGIM
jgi:hypothetical protein